MCIFDKKKKSFFGFKLKVLLPTFLEKGKCKKKKRFFVFYRCIFVCKKSILLYAVAYASAVLKKRRTQNFDQ